MPPDYFSGPVSNSRQRAAKTYRTRPAKSASVPPGIFKYSGGCWSQPPRRSLGRRAVLAPHGDEVVPAGAGLESVARIRGIGRRAGRLALRILAAERVDVRRAHLGRSEAPGRGVDLDLGTGAVIHRHRLGVGAVRAQREEVAEEGRLLVGIGRVRPPADGGVGRVEPERDVDARRVDVGLETGGDVLLT